MREVVVRGADGPLAQQITIGPHVLRGDEPVSNGGEDSGPSPHELLLAALGTCTAMTIRLYAARKGWAVTDVHVRLSGGRVEDTFQISEQLTLVGDLNEEQRQRLLEIATRCPVHRTLRGKVAIDAIEMSA